MTVNQALDILFLLESTEEIKDLIIKLRKSKLFIGGRGEISEKIEEQIKELQSDI